MNNVKSSRLTRTQSNLSQCVLQENNEATKSVSVDNIKQTRSFYIGDYKTIDRRQLNHFYQVHSTYAHCVTPTIPQAVLDKKLKQIDKELASMAMQVNGAKNNVIDENVSLDSTTTQNSFLRCDRFCTIL